MVYKLKITYAIILFLCLLICLTIFTRDIDSPIEYIYSTDQFDILIRRNGKAEILNTSALYYFKGIVTKKGVLKTIGGRNDIVRIVGQNNILLILKRSGELWAIGSPPYLATDYENRYMKTPKRVANNIYDMSVFHGTSLVVDKYHHLYEFGFDCENLHLSIIECAKNPLIKIADKVEMVSRGNNYTLILKTDGTIWSYGNFCTKEIKDATHSLKMKRLHGLNNIRFVSSNGAIPFFINNEDELFILSGKDCKLKLIASGVDSVSSSLLHAFFIKKDSSLWIYGDNSIFPCPNEEKSCKMPRKIMENVKQVSTSPDRVGILNNDGEFITKSSSIIFERDTF